MGREDHFDDELLRTALTAFSDACVLPHLSPACPYCRSTADGVTCGEECRSLLEERGVSRPTQDVTVLPGLVMRGVVRPIEVASGTLPFDATQLLLCEEQLPVTRRSTTTLLLQLRAHVATPPWGRAEDDAEVFMELGVELAARDLEVIGILKGSVAAAVAESILRQVDQPDNELDPPLLLAWRQVRADHLDGRLDVESQAGRDEGFIDRTRSWLVRLCEEDPGAYLGWQTPPVALFRDMPLTPPDPVGSWIWTRFTEPDLGQWPFDCLLRERAAILTGDFHGIDARVFRAFRYEESEVTRAAMAWVQGLPQIQMAPTDLSARQFVRRALVHLQRGETQVAADIFAALSVVRPGDVEARNNLGFCLIPITPVQALNVLRDAAGFHQSDPALNKANQAIALHLAGRDNEALAVLDRAVSDLAGLSPDPGKSWWVWSEQETCGEVQIREESDLSAYVARLREHLLAHGPSIGGVLGS